MTSTYFTAERPAVLQKMDKPARKRIVRQLDRIYIGLLVAVICFCVGILKELDAEDTRAAEIPAAPEKAQAAVTTEPIPVAYLYAAGLAEEPKPRDLFVAREDIPLDRELKETVWDASEEYGVGCALVLGVMEVESSFRMDAVSEKNCYGLMQLNTKYFPSDLTPEENVRQGVAYLAEKLDQYDGDFEAALTAYHAGHDTGDRTYAEKVLRAAERWFRP